MKKQLLLYLFILSLLMNVFTYMYFSKKEASTQKKYDALNLKIADTVQVLNNKLFDADYFALETNDRAQNYLANYNITELMPKVKDALMEYNSDPEGNRYVDQPKVGEQKFIINKIKILNHRWIIADYSNGTLWGEVLLKYFIEPDNTISFENIATYLYSEELN